MVDEKTHGLPHSAGSTKNEERNPEGTQVIVYSG